MLWAEFWMLRKEYMVTFLIHCVIVYSCDILYIWNIKIKRNFAFIHYESHKDATRALDATNLRFLTCFEFTYMFIFCVGKRLLYCMITLWCLFWNIRFWSHCSCYMTIIFWLTICGVLYFLLRCIPYCAKSLPWFSILGMMMNLPISIGPHRFVCVCI